VDIRLLPWAASCSYNDKTPELLYELLSQEPKMLEELTGLAAMHAAAELADFDMEVPDSEDGDEWTTL
jgi:hypothetical protein